MKKVTKKQQQEFLKEKLSTSRVWALNALIKIYANQTEDEQNSENTIEANGIGFSGLDGMILSSFAVQYKRRGSLSEKQMNIVMKKMKKYWRQILEISDIEKLNKLIQA